MDCPLDQGLLFSNLDEEDKIFAGQRESPRARPKMEKFVKLIPIGNNQASFYKLFDLSRGGLDSSPLKRISSQRELMLKF